MLNELEEVNEILKGKIETKRQEIKQEYITKYPLGFVVFAIDKNKNLVIPYNDPLSEKYKIDWTELKVDVYDQSIAFYTPNLIYKGFEIEPIKIIGRRKGGPKSYSFNIFDLAIHFEILSDDIDGFVCLMGFSNSTLK